MKKLKMKSAYTKRIDLQDFLDNFYINICIYEE